MQIDTGDDIESANDIVCLDIMVCASCLTAYLILVYPTLYDFQFAMLDWKLDESKIMA